MNRLFRRIARRFSILFAIVIIVTICVSYFYLNDAYVKHTQESLLSEARVIAYLAEARSDIGQISTAMEEKQGVRVTVISNDGTVLMDTEADASQLESHLGRPEVQQALKAGEGTDIRRSDTLGKDLIYVAVSAPETGYVIRLAMPLEGIAEYSMNLLMPLLVILLVSFLLCLVISLYISRSITLPLTRMKRYAARIALGEYDGITPLHTGDELEDLSVAMNDMAGALKRSVEDITEKNSRLQAVFRAVPGGILAIDNHEIVTMINPAATEMFAIREKPEGRHFLEVVKHAKLEMVIREALEKRVPVEREIRMVRGMEERFLQVFSVPVVSEGIAFGVILLAQDITRIRKLENMRSEFAANVSHELKTPLTVISGFVDTLKGPDITPEDTTRFLDIISLESERLTRLIDDVLSLSEIESASAPPAAIVDIRQGVREAAELLQRNAEEKDIALTVELPKVRIPVAADKDRVKQMMINLIDNAIKYTPKGGRVQVSVEREEENCILRVSDTGIGIPEENLPRLFERFYRVDKSRSRSLGGTGLGLAIVKHIVSLLGGRIDVQSRVGQGTVFAVTVPVGKRDI